MQEVCGSDVDDNANQQEKHLGASYPRPVGDDKYEEQCPGDQSQKPVRNVEKLGPSIQPVDELVGAVNDHELPLVFETADYRL